jgi:hypothetical protein
LNHYFSHQAGLEGFEPDAFADRLIDYRPRYSRWVQGQLILCLAKSLIDQGAILQNCSIVQAVFYFVLLLPQFGSASANTRDSAPKSRIAHKHPIESGFRETQ